MPVKPSTPNETERETMPRKKLARVSTPMIDIPASPASGALDRTLEEAAQVRPLAREPAAPVVLSAPVRAEPAPLGAPARETAIPAGSPASASAAASQNLEHPAA